MYRAVPTLLLGLSISLLAIAAPTPDAKETAKQGPTAEEIKKAIDDLGSPRFAVRDKAKKFLLDAGQAAEKLLAEAAKSSDQEISASAKAILEKFEWGLYPDTPKAVRDLIEQFRSGDPEQRQNAIGLLLKQKPVPFASIRKLLSREENEELREQMLARMYQQVRETIPQLMLANDFEAVEQMFELTFSGMPAMIGHDYATLMYLRNKVDPAIARFEKERAKKGEEGKKATEMLVYLYRVKGDWAAARKAATDISNDDLVERIAWQASDWKTLATLPNRPDFGNYQGLVASYLRLAGQKKEFGERIADIKKSAEDFMGDDGEVRAQLRLDADALFLNGRSEEAIKILRDRGRELGMVFDILCAQMKHKEAFALVDEARRRDTDPAERQQIEIRRARMLYMLGEKDAAIQLFRKLSAEIKNRNDFSLALALIKAEVRCELRDEALEHAASAMDQLLRDGPPFSLVAGLLEPNFGTDKDLAAAWWRLMRADKPDEKPADAMKRVKAIISGKLERKQLDEWIAKMQKHAQQRLQPDAPVPQGRSDFAVPFHSLDAIAAAYKAIGDDAKAEEFYKKAAEKFPSSEHWIAYGDFLMSKKRFKEAAESFGKAARSSRSGSQDIEIGDDGIILNQESYGPSLPTYLQGQAAIAAGDAAEGKRLFELAHWMPLGNEIIRARLVDELNKRDLPDQARREAEMLVKTGWYNDLSFGNVLNFLARQAAKDKDYFLAADCYEKCIVGCLRTGASFVESTAYLSVPEAVRVYRARGLISKGKIAEALEQANANLEVMPGNIEVALKLVPELEKAGKKKEADAIYEKVRDSFAKLSKDYPNSAFARNSLAWLMANCRRDMDEALKHSQKAVEIEPKNAGYIDTLAEVWFRKGDREKATTFMKQCAELDPKNVYFRKQLARFKDQPFDSPLPDDGEEEE